MKVLYLSFIICTVYSSLHASNYSQNKVLLQSNNINSCNTVLEKPHEYEPRHIIFQIGQKQYIFTMNYDQFTTYEINNFTVQLNENEVQKCPFYRADKQKLLNSNTCKSISNKNDIRDNTYRTYYKLNIKENEGTKYYIQLLQKLYKINNTLNDNIYKNGNIPTKFYTTTKRGTKQKDTSISFLRSNNFAFNKEFKILFNVLFCNILNTMLNSSAIKKYKLSKEIDNIQKYVVQYHDNSEKINNALSKFIEQVRYNNHPIYLFRTSEISIRIIQLIVLMTLILH